MKILPFRSSMVNSLGIELEFQIINSVTGDLENRAKELIYNTQKSFYKKFIKPEITQSMIEINSSVHNSPKKLNAELIEIRNFLFTEAEKQKVSIAGGGTHPFERWNLQKIFPSKRFKNQTRQYRYLSKRSTVFGQHIHVGCQNGEDAIYLTHALARYVPHFIALSASSPFYQGIDTGYHSTRTTIFNTFPLSGVMPSIYSWEAFSEYFYKMRDLGIIQSMKDFHWDVRPKPEFGTVELRVCDTPLTIRKAVIISAYAQSLTRYLLKERPAADSSDLYFLYGYNRFQASRYGLRGHFTNPFTLKRNIIADDIMHTIKTIEKHTSYLNNTYYISKLKADVMNGKDDSQLLKEVYKKSNSMLKVVAKQCALWRKK